MKDDNIGQTGLESIRFDGLKLENLPLGQGNEAKVGLKEFLQTDKETKKNNIIAKFPKHKIKYLKTQIRDYKIKEKRIKKNKKKLTQCDKDSISGKEKIKEINRKYLPYDVEALEQQIVQFEEGIDRCDNTIEQDHNSIVQIERVLALVEQRDKEVRGI